jgi:hypothetical protein
MHIHGHIHIHIHTHTFTNTHIVSICAHAQKNQKQNYMFTGFTSCPQQNQAHTHTHTHTHTQVVATKDIQNKEQRVQITALLSIDALDALALIQSPCILHLLHTRDLRALLETPLMLHGRQCVCVALCASLSEIIVSCIDGRICIYTISARAANESAVAPSRGINSAGDELAATCRVSWSLAGGAHYARAFVIDEGFHTGAYRVMGIVDTDIVCWDWYSAAQLFVISNAHVPLSNRVTCIELRRDVPLLVGGFRRGAMSVWSLRQGSCGKVTAALYLES